MSTPDGPTLPESHLGSMQRHGLKDDCCVMGRGDSHTAQQQERSKQTGEVGSQERSVDQHGHRRGYLCTVGEEWFLPSSTATRSNIFLELQKKKPSRNI